MSFYISFSNCFRLMRDWKQQHVAKAKKRSAFRLPNEKRGLPLEVVYNFRKDFLENCSSI